MVVCPDTAIQCQRKGYRRCVPGVTRDSAPCLFETMSVNNWWHETNAGSDRIEGIVQKLRRGHQIQMSSLYQECNALVQLVSRFALGLCRYDEIEVGPSEEATASDS